MSKSAEPKITVIIINWNAWSHLQRCLTSIRNSTFSDLEILVGDNGSTDGTLEGLASKFPEVTVHANNANIGHSPGLNREFGRARGSYILILDPDTEVKPDAIEIMYDFMETHPEATLVSARMLTPDGEVEESARAFPSAINGVFGRQSLLTRLFPGNRFSRRYLMSEQVGQTEPYQVEQVSGACMFFRREVLQETGPWDDAYHSYWVDTDWCMSLAALGKKVYCVPRARIVHYEHNKRGRRKSAFRIWLFHRGAYRLYRKHSTAGYLDPRAMIAYAALGSRALGQIAMHSTVLPLMDRIRKREPNAASNQQTVDDRVDDRNGESAIEAQPEVVSEPTTAGPREND